MKKLMMIAALMLMSVGAFAQRPVGGLTIKPMVGMTLATITGGNADMKVGLQPGFIVSAKYKENKTSTDAEHQTLELSVPIGASYEFKQFVFDARYNLGLSKVNKGNGSIRNSVFQITVGYRFDL